ncbi:ATP-binding protein [Geobacter sp. AOG1]|uniref:ATP-binding protein n=1 Tax=Geobacter sp. AOG1 TaxID=1566346 RepID=UPI001CC7E137|nr:ATP-binding protein [Geobacter sp. AOG1]GFE58805.1 hypothetical protein AOG1_26850 [Geobacter sp. AOG1]
MTKFLNLPIRSQLIILAVLLTLPALGIIVYSGLKQRADAYDDAVVESQKLADNLAAQQESLTNEAKLLCMLLSDLPEVKSHNVKKIQSILATILKENPKYINILIADAAGYVWASAVPINKMDTLADRRYFENAQRTLQFSSGEYAISKSTKKPTVHMAYPLVERNEFKGVVVVGFDLDAMRSILEQSQLPGGSNYIITDHNGIIISRGKNVGQDVGKPIQLVDLKRMENGPDKETYEFTRIDGDPRITTYHKIRLKGEQTPYIYIRAGISKKDALAKANRALIINLSTLLSFVLLAFGLAFIIGKHSIIDRISLLQRASQRLASGDLDFKVSDHLLGGELGILGQTFDTMAYQVASREKALHESQQFLTTIIENEPECVKLLAPDDTILMMNRAGLDMFQLESFDQIKGKTLYSFIAPEYLEAYKATNKDVFNGKQKRFEFKITGAKGRPIWLEAHVVPLRNNDGEIVSLLGITHNITERKEMDNMKDEMISAVSHDMRTPLAAMLGYLQFVMENPVEEEQMRDYLGIMYREGNRLNELISGFLDMQRFKAKQKTYVFKPIDVRPIVEEAAAIFACPSDKHQVVTDLPSDLPLILGDELLLHQAFSNLLSNAIKYSPGGCEIILGAKSEKDSVTLWVKDEGIGIQPELLDKIFDMFYRVDNKSSRQTNGTGLGLALVKEIVNAHSGRVWVESEPEKGSIFYITLPVANR